MPADQRAGRRLRELGRRERERRGDGGVVRHRAGFGRQLRDGEAGAAALLRAALERAAHRTDSLLQDDFAAGGAAVTQAEQHRRPDRRMAGERQLPHRA